jgi:hypothetical protein
MIEAMRLSAAVLCLALSGCENLFQLNDLRPSVDASTIDAIEIDAYTGPTPAGCWSGAYKGDEDQDAVVDGCDNCPLMDNRGQEDRDGDKVGDICDPNPDEPLEKIAYFHPMVVFNGNEWAAAGSHGNWQDNEFGIQQANNGNPTTDVSTYVRVQTQERIAFDQPMAQLIVKQVTPDEEAGLSGDSRSAVGLYVITATEDSSIGIPSGVRCGINFPLASSNATASAFVEKHDTNNNGAAAIAGAVVPALITVSTLRPNQSPDMVTPTCTVRNAPGITGLSTPVFDAHIPTNGVRIGVWTKNTSATFLALFVTERRLL